MTLKERSLKLREMLAGLESVLIAYSGGTDSAFLAYEAHRVLGGRMLASDCGLGFAAAQGAGGGAGVYGAAWDSDAHSADRGDGRPELCAERCAAVFSLQG